jgi:hypothetical protein
MGLVLKQLDRLPAEELAQIRATAAAHRDAAQCGVAGCEDNNRSETA